MKFLVLCMLVGVCLANKKKHHEEPAKRTGGDNLRPSKVPFPDYFRVEVEIQRMENNGSMRSDGKACDWGSACDPEISAVIDIERPLSPFPGATPPTGKWPVIFTATNVDSPVIGRSVNRDLCGAAVDKVNARVNVLDADTPGLYDTVNNFDCLFDVSPRDIAADAPSAQWGESTPCKAYFLGSKMKLFARQRAYQISAADCGVGTTGVKQNTEVASASTAQTHIPGEHDLIRLDVEVVQLLNPQGITYNKVPCDTTTKCDPEINVHLDTDKPLADFPGSKTITEFTLLFKTTDVDGPVVNKNISKDICGGTLNNVNLRAHVVDRDTLSTADVIESFNCLFKLDYKIVKKDASSAEWTPTQNCVALHPGHDIRLQYRYRAYDISPLACGVSPPVAKPLSK